MPFRLERIPSSSSSSSSTNILLLNKVCDAGLIVGDWVRQDISNVFQKGQANTFDNAQVKGVVIAKPTGTTCNVVTHGQTGDIFTSLDPTKNYFLSESTAGEMSDSIPSNIFKPLGMPLSSTNFNVNVGNTVAY